MFWQGGTARECAGWQGPVAASGGDRSLHIAEKGEWRRHVDSLYKDLWLLQVEIRGLHTAEKSEWWRKMDCVYIACIRWMYPHTTLKGRWCSWVDYKAVSTTCRGQDVHADRSTDTYTKCARTCSCTHIGTNISHSTALQWTEGMSYIFSLRLAEKVCDEISKSFCTLRWCVSF